MLLPNGNESRAQKPAAKDSLVKASSTLHSEQKSSGFPRDEYQGDGVWYGFGVWREMTKSG